MAIDTAAKRASVQGYTFGLVRPPPDGEIGTVDRAAAAWFYAGFQFQVLELVGGSTAATPAVFWMIRR
jgi:hypothetical protein